MAAKKSIKTEPSVSRVRRSGSAESRDGWEIVLAGEFTDEQVELLVKLTEVPYRSAGTIYFESCGGSTYVGLGLASLIRLRGLSVTGIALGECSSAALMPFAVCRRRLLTPHTSLFFHPIRWASEEDIRLEEAAEWTRHFGVMEHELDGLLAEWFGISIERLRQWTQPGRFVTGKEMAEAGLAELLDLRAGDWKSQLASRPSGA